MAITAADILFKQSTTAGAAGDSTAGGAAGTNLGKYMSSTQIVDATLDNLFDNVTGDENAASQVDYQCFFVHNAHATITWESVMCWIASETAGGASTAIGLDPAGVVPHAQAGAQAAQIANDTTAPVGVTFSAPTTKVTGLAIGNIPAGSVQAVWIRRTAANSSALDLDGVIPRVEGDTSA